MLIFTVSRFILSKRKDRRDVNPQKANSRFTVPRFLVSSLASLKNVRISAGQQAPCSANLKAAASAYKEMGTLLHEHSRCL